MRQARGDIVRIETGGGGGWGHPFDREAGPRRWPTCAAASLPPTSAPSDYGVVLGADGTSVDCGRHRRSSGAAPRGEALPPSRLPRRAGLMANPSEPRSGCLIGVDTGGTFTDVTLLDPATGRRLDG